MKLDFSDHDKLKEMIQNTLSDDSQQNYYFLNETVNEKIINDCTIFSEGEKKVLIKKNASREYFLGSIMSKINEKNFDEKLLVMNEKWLDVLLVWRNKNEKTIITNGL